MVLQQVQLAVRDGVTAAFEAALCEVRQRVFMCAGFRGFAVAESADEARHYLVQVRWETAEELLAVAESGRFERCWAPVQPFLDGAPAVTHLVERPGLAFTGPGVVTDLSWAAVD